MRPSANTKSLGAQRREIDERLEQLAQTIGTLNRRVDSRPRSNGA